MSAHAESAQGGLSLVIRGRSYPVLLPKLRDPRLQLAAVIISLQVLGQVAFDFQLSIAQILISLFTCAVLEVGIAAWRQRVILWPASALLTGNGVAFVLRVPGTVHGDWWSTRGWWIFAGTAAVSLLSKYLIKFRGGHIFNPSNFGLVLCFLILGKERATPLDFWWGPMSPWMALALTIIVVGGLAILLRIHLIGIAIGFWLAFAAGIGVVALGGHAMEARWHLGPITGASFWWVLITSPEILVFTFFMITDPKTVPRGRVARLVYAVGLGLLATLLIAPQTTEFGAKVALLGSLTLVCAARPLIEWVVSARVVSRRRAGAARLGVAGAAGAAAFVGLVILAGLPARPGTASAARPVSTDQLPRVTILHSTGVSSQIDRRTALVIADDLIADLRTRADALRLRNAGHASAGVSGAVLVDLQRQIRSAQGREIAVPSYSIDGVSLKPKAGEGQGPPTIVATVTGAVQRAVYTGSPPKLERQDDPMPFTGTFELGQSGAGYVIVNASGVTPLSSSPSPSTGGVTVKLGGLRLHDVASQVGLNFRQDSFRFGMSNDVGAMMGGGLCWLDYNNDGWEDLFVVNSYSDGDIQKWDARGGLPRSALFENVTGTFVNVSRSSHADLAVKGNGCVAADFNGDGNADLLVTTTDGVRLLWGNGNGTFTEGARAAGMDASGWYAGAAVADVNGDGRPDVVVAGYTDPNDPIPGSNAGFPTHDAGVRDLLYLNEGPDRNGRSRFREVGVAAGLEAANFEHGLGAVFTDYNGDGRPDLYVANDEDPNQLYENVAWPGGAKADPTGLGFRFEERAASEGVADRYAGMGIADADYSGDGKNDLFVSNSRREPSAAYIRNAKARAPAFANARPAFLPALGTSFAGWGDSWVDLANDGKLDLVLAAGAIPVTSLSKDAEPVRVLARVAGKGRPEGFGSAVAALGRGALRLNGRGLAAADVDNNGRMDVAINTIGGRLVLLRSTGPVGHWLDVKLDTFSPGALITAVLPSGRRLVREVQAGSSYLSSEDPRVHFGLGGATKLRELVVRFAGGAVSRLTDVAADRVVDVGRPPSAVPAVLEQQSYRLGACSRGDLGGRSVARVWNEAALAELRRGLAAPTTQARDLFHLSVAMWDAWAAYDPVAEGYIVNEKAKAADVAAARDAAISYAAYRLLLWQASYGANLRQTFGPLTATMRSLCYSTDFTSTAGDSPAALGNRIAAAVIAYGQHDGSLERQHYIDPSYVPQNDPMVVSRPGSAMHDPNLWQPLALGQVAVQGLAPIPAHVQTFTGSQWGHVRGFALRTPAAAQPIDPGAPPIGGPATRSYKRAAVDVIRASSRKGRTVVGSAPVNWNARANAVANSSLQRDVKLYFALNGALHDAAIAAWGAKRTYQAPRPISMIRYMAFEGQSSDPKAPSYNAEGLPLVPGLIELITSRSSAPGQPFSSLAGDVGQVAVRTRTGWVLGTRWLPDRPTPSSPGWVSGESAFAFAADEVLTHATGRSFASTAVRAGASGLEEGIDLRADDLAGRKLGAAVGKRAWSLARRYFAGTALR